MADKPPCFETFHDRAVFCADASGLSHRRISARANLPSPQHFGLIYRGDVKVPRETAMRRLAETFGVQLQWLAFGEGEAPTAEDVRLHVERTAPEQETDDGPEVDRSEEYAQPDAAEVA